MTKALTSDQHVSKYVDNPDIRRARIDRLPLSGAALATLVTEEDAADISRVCTDGRTVADEAEASQDRATAYAEMDVTVEHLADWLAGMVSGPEYTRGLASGLYDTPQACRAALQGAGAAEDEYAYRELGASALRAAEAYVEACKYAVALYVSNRTVAYHRSQDLGTDCVTAWRQAGRILGHRVLLYRKLAYAEGKAAVRAAGSCFHKLNSQLGGASRADDDRRSFRQRMRY